MGGAGRGAGGEATPGLPPCSRTSSPGPATPRPRPARPWGQGPWPGASPAAILLDLGLPTARGALLGDLRADPALAAVPVLVVSALADALPPARRAWPPASSPSPLAPPPCSPPCARSRPTPPSDPLPRRRRPGGSRRRARGAGGGVHLRPAGARRGRCGVGWEEPRPQQQKKERTSTHPGRQHEGRAEGRAQQGGRPPPVAGEGDQRGNTPACARWWTWRRRTPPPSAWRRRAQGVAQEGQLAGHHGSTGSRRAPRSAPWSRFGGAGEEEGEEEDAADQLDVGEQDVLRRACR